MEVAKTFERNGVRYRPGDKLPPDLDKDVLAHYQRHGMVREARTPGPAETKPAAPARKAATPKVPKPVTDPKPAETKDASKDEAASADAQISSDVKDDQTQQHQTQSATDGVAAASAASDAKTE
jgi:hypothetical protein